MKNAIALLTLLVAVAAFAQDAQFDPSGNLISHSGGKTNSPTFLGPASRLVKPGGAASFSVAASGSGLSFRWFFNNTLVPTATSDTLLVTNAGAPSVGNYFVVVSNSVGSVTSVVARLELDSDRDLLGDSWELANFGSLTNQNGAMDKDNDRTVNRVEFQDGTNPTNAAALLPRLNVFALGGGVALSPDKLAYQTNDIVTLTAVPDPGLSFIGWTGDLVGSTNPATLAMTGNRTVQAIFGIPLSTALNTTNPVITGGLGGWFGQTNVTYDFLSPAAATVLPLAGAGDAFLETRTVTTKDGTASFHWKIDGEQNNVLRLWINGQLLFSESRWLYGTTGWRAKTVFLPAGTNLLRWTYTRNGGGWTESINGDKPLDRAYVDELIVTEYAVAAIDSDANGLPDLWEYRYFDLLGNNPNSDPDADGVNTVTELSDGTDPNNFSSVKPRLTFLVEGQGTATAVPSLASYLRDQYVTNTATADPGWKFIGWVAQFGSFPVLSLQTNNPSVDYMRRSKTFKAIFGLPPGLAADAPALTWTTSSNYPWYGQTLVAKDGTNAAQSSVGATLQNSSDSWLETSVTGPGTLSFFWKASSATNSDYLTLLVNSNELAGRISGQADWRPVVVLLGAGPQTLRWNFRRFFGYDTNAQNSVWLDSVKFTPGTSAPEFINLPATLLGFATSNLTFNATAAGTPVISYQVFRGATPLTAVTTNAQLTVSNVSASLSGTWSVRAQNAAGTTNSAPIPVTILGRPANDAFATRAALSGATPVFHGYTFGASPENNEPSHGAYSARASVWHTWTAPANGLVKAIAIATNPPSTLTIAAYTGTSIGGLVDVKDDDAFAVDTNGIRVATVEIVWRAIAGTTYQIAVDAGAGGAFYRLSLENMPPPVNDPFAGGINLVGSFVVISGDTSLASPESGDPPIFGFPGFPQFNINGSNTLWWKWTAPASGRLEIINQTGSTPYISMFTGSTLGSLVRLYDPYQGTELSDVVQGVTYSISADSYPDNGGPFSFTLAMPDSSGSSIAPRLELVPAQNIAAGSITVRGLANTAIQVHFSPNLTDWYLWSTATIPQSGVVTISLAPPQYTDPDTEEVTAIPPASKRFFRVVAQ